MSAHVARLVQELIAFCSDRHCNPEIAALAGIKLIDDDVTDPVTLVSPEVESACDTLFQEPFSERVHEMSDVLVAELILDGVLKNPATVVGPLTALLYAQMRHDGTNAEGFKQVVIDRARPFLAGTKPS